MSNKIDMEIYLPKVLDALDSAVYDSLESAIGEIETQTKKNTKVTTGRTKASWEHRVDMNNYTAYVGSNYENAIWEEFGTGTEAQHGNGRKDVPWVYQDEQGKWHRTSGKKPRKALQKAFEMLKNTINSWFESRFGKL